MHMISEYEDGARCEILEKFSSQSAQRGHVFHIYSYLYRKHIVYFGYHAMMTYAPRGSALREVRLPFNVAPNVCAFNNSNNNYNFCEHVARRRSIARCCVASLVGLSFLSL